MEFKMDSLEVRALRKLPQLQGKSLQEIIEICDIDPLLAAICYKSMSSVQALAEIIEDIELSEFLLTRCDLRDSELRNFIKAINEGFIWDYGYRLVDFGRSPVMSKRKLIALGEFHRKFILINGTLPSKGTHGAVISFQSIYKNDDDEDQNAVHEILVTWNSDEDYATTKEFKRKILKIGLSNVYFSINFTMERFDVKELFIRSNGNGTRVNPDESQDILENCINYLTEFQDLNIFTDQDDMKEVIVIATSNYYTHRFQFVIKIDAVEF